MRVNECDYRERAGFGTMIVIPMFMRCALLFLMVAGMAGCGGDGGSETPPAGRVYFMSDRDGNEEIYVIPAQGGTAANLTSDPAADSEPNVDSTGRSVAFSSSRGDGTSGIWAMEATGGAARLLTPQARGDYSPVWSPDATRVAFTSTVDQSRGLLWMVDLPEGEPYPLLDAISPSTPEVVCAGGFPGSWTPDGQSVIYRGSQGDIRAGQVCSVGIDGSEIQPIYGEEGVAVEHPVMSPDGKRIVFASNRSGNLDIYVMTADGEDVKRLTQDPGNDMDPVWSPDGKWIAFASERDGDFEIYVVQSDGSDLRKLTDNEFVDSQPSWGR